MKKIFGVFFLIISVICFICTFYTHFCDFNIPVFKNANANVRINVKIPAEFKNDIELKANNVLLTPFVFDFKNEYISYEFNNFPLYILTIKAGLIPVDNVVLSIGQKIFYYTKDEILKFQKSENGALIFPKDMKYLKDSLFINDKGILKNFFTCFLSIFYNPKFYIIPFIFLIISCIFLRPKIQNLWWILILGFILRLADLSLDFWTDEIYTAFMAGNPNLPFITAFQDPGNPPLFFIAAKFWMKALGQNEFNARLLNVLISTFSIYFIYKFTKDNFQNSSFAPDTNAADYKENNAAALFTAFLFAINIYSIISAQELRCYALCILLNILAGIYLFKIIKRSKTKDFILYSLLLIFMINTHYFEAFIILSNFIFAMIFMEKKYKIKFLLLHILPVISFLPYFLMTGLNQGLLNSGFNIFSRPNLFFYLDVFEKFSICKFFLAAVILFSIFTFKNKKPKLYYYSLYSIVFVFLFSYLFCFIKPVAKEYYFIILLPCFIFLPVLICFYSHKTKFLKIFFIFLILISFFYKNEYILRDKTSFINLKRLMVYYFADSSENTKNAVIFPYDIKMYKKAYSSYLNEKTGIFQIQNLTKQNLGSLINVYDAVYFYAPFNLLNTLLRDISKLHKLSIIRTDNDILIVKVEK